MNINNLHLQRLRPWLRLPHYFFSQFQPRIRAGLDELVIIYEDAGWSIAEDAKAIFKECARQGLPARLETSPLFFRNRLIHFSSIYSFLHYEARLHSSNKCTATFFHAAEGLDQALDQTIQAFRERHERLDRIFVSCSSMEERLVKWGVAPGKIVRVPIGIDTQLFSLPTEGNRAKARAQFHVPEGSVCIGSFQKDGNGWGAGLTPKLIKGPDIFLATLERLKEKMPLFVLLSGPARGYVRAGLDRLGISYHHHFANDIRELNEMYWALDLYIVSSRAEGGPKAMHECFATGVPLVTTNVGMVPDVATHQRNAWITPIGDAEGLSQACLTLWQDQELRERLRADGATIVESLGWNKVLSPAIGAYAELLGG